MSKPDLFGYVKPRQKPRKLMHISDASPGVNPPHGIKEGASIFIFSCSRCDYETDWMWVDTDTEARRGMPCPVCNNEVIE